MSGVACSCGEAAAPATCGIAALGTVPRGGSL